MKPKTRTPPRKKPPIPKPRKDPAADIAPAPKQDGDADEETGPLRRCIVTRERRAKELMIRFVQAPDGQILPDLAARLPGRGMWLSADADVLERASKRGAFAKATRGSAVVPPDLRLRIEDALRGRIVDLIGLARRAGQAVSGWQAAREWLHADRVGLLVQASDGSVAERARLLGHRPVVAVAPLTAARLGALFGRDHAVHVAIARGRLAETIAAEAARLAGISAEAERLAGISAEAERLAGIAAEAARLAGILLAEATPEGVATIDDPAPDEDRDGPH